MRLGQPAAAHAAFDAFEKAVIGFGYFSPPGFFATIRTKTWGSILPAEDCRKLGTVVFARVTEQEFDQLCQLAS